MSVITLAMASSSLGFLDHREGHVLVAIAVQRVHDSLQDTELDVAVTLDRRGATLGGFLTTQLRDFLLLLPRELEARRKWRDFEIVAIQRLRHRGHTLAADQD